MDDSDSGSTLQTLASVLAGGLSGYVDAQQSQPITVTAPAPQTAYGVAGTGQGTPAATAALPSWIIPLAVVGLVLVLVLKK